MVTRSEIKYIQSLHAGKHRKAQRQFVAEGNHMALEALQSFAQNILKIYAVPHWIAANKDRIGALSAVEVSTTDMERITLLSTPGPVLLLLQMPDYSTEKREDHQWSLCLDGVQDPGNVGTIIRIADWFGIPQVICGEGSADAYNPKTVQASMGSIFRVKTLQTNLSDWLGGAPVIYGALLSGQSVWETATVKPGPLVIGGEGAGISPEVQRLITHALTIPRVGAAESLNAAVAAGILCSHICRTS